MIAGPVLLAACADDANDRATGAPATTEPPRTGVVVEVIAIDNNFRPETVEISVGDEVVWQNRGRDDHDVVPIDSEGWGIGLDEFGPGEEYRHVFTEPGTYRYYCTIHATHTAGMIGTVIVSE